MAHIPFAKLPVPSADSASTLNRATGRLAFAWLRSACRKLAKYPVTLATWGAGAGVFAALLLSTVPLFKNDVLKKIPVVNSYFVGESPFWLLAEWWGAVYMWEQCLGLVCVRSRSSVCVRGGMLA